MTLVNLLRRFTPPAAPRLMREVAAHRLQEIIISVRERLLRRAVGASAAREDPPILRAHGEGERLSIGAPRREERMQDILGRPEVSLPQRRIAAERAELEERRSRDGRRGRVSRRERARAGPPVAEDAVPIGVVPRAGRLAEGRVGPEPAAALILLTRSLVSG